MEWLLLSASNELPSNHSYKACVHSDVCGIGKDNRAILHCNARQLGCALVNQQGHTCWHENNVVVNGGKINSPCSIIAPLQQVQKLRPDDSFVVVDGDCEGVPRWNTGSSSHQACDMYVAATYKSTRNIVDQN